MITTDRLLHSLEVARRAREYAREIGLNESEADACFVMGILHDIGYEDIDEVNNAKVHPIVSEQMVHSFLNNKIACATAIGMHGSYLTDMNKYDFILNKADMTTDGQGNRCTYEERLLDIEKRRGKDSEAYKSSLKMIEVLKEKENNYINH